MQTLNTKRTYRSISLPLIYVCVGIIAGLQTPANAQNMRDSGEESLHGIYLNTVSQGKIGGMYLSEVPKDITILYFWSTWCSSCIRTMPLLDSLQAVFQDQVTIIPVTQEGDDKVTALFEKNEMLRNVALPIAIADTSLSRYFPHRGVPHVVWLGKSMEERAITGGKVINAENIRNMLTDKHYELPRKRGY